MSFYQVYEKELKRRGGNVGAGGREPELSASGEERVKAYVKVYFRRHGSYGGRADDEEGGGGGDARDET